MTADAAALSRPLADGTLTLEPLAEHHREALRAACAADADIWNIYPISYLGGHFDPAFDQLLSAPARVMLAVLRNGTLIGMSGFLNIAPDHHRLEIGSSYIIPAERGTGTNQAMKALMIGQAFASGFDRVEFKVDSRNARSQAAVAKLGATREGVMRHQMTTWTGYRRDTVLFSLLRDEWAAS